jgi:CheY-like chemotaxis protein
MRRILFADDSPAVRKALAQLLAGTYSVFEAEDGRAALARARELRPDLIILDLAMPAMDGLSAAREISKILPEVPILLYTMHWASSLALAAREFGIRKVISKGQSEELLAQIEQLLQVSSEDRSQLDSSVQEKKIEAPTEPPDSAIIAAAEQRDGQPAPEPQSKKLAS